MAKAPLDIRSLARAHTQTALNTLAGIMVSKGAPPSARVAAAQTLIDRGWGKATQHIQAELSVIDQLSIDGKRALLAALESDAGGQADSTFEAETRLN